MVGNVSYQEPIWVLRIPLVQGTQRRSRYWAITKAYVQPFLIISLFLYSNFLAMTTYW
jgi:hypothetical protein